MITCEHIHCNETIDFDQSHSAVAVLQRVDTQGYTFFQCEDGQVYNNVTYQHFHCSHEHMIVNFASCVQDHYNESLLHPIPPGEGRTILHQIVLGSHLLCNICESPLVDVAYRFCLTHCTPQNSVLDQSLDELGEWTCSLEHAKQSALAIIGSM